MSILKIPTKELTYDKKVALKQLLERFGYPKKGKWKLFCELLNVPEKEVRAYLDSDDGQAAMKQGRYSPIRHDINDLLDLKDEQDLNPTYTRSDAEIEEFIQDHNLHIEQVITGKVEMEHGGKIKDLRSNLDIPEDQENDE